MSYKIDDIEGIGPSFAKKLASAKIATTEELLKLCGNPQGRKAVAASTGIGEGKLLDWANMADLMRVSGVSTQYSELLKAAGVDTVKELAQRKADNLAAKVQEVNTAKHLAKATPTVADIQKWVAQAKNLDPRISY
jgi:predicted flap endonuclease-1-like 5' DNA nuclease